MNGVGPLTHVCILKMQRLIFKLTRLILKYKFFILYPNLKFKGGFKLGKGFFILSESNKYSITIGNEFQSRLNLLIYMDKMSTLNIGDKVFFNNNCSINCFATIIIGSNTIIGENVKFYDHNHDFEFIENNLSVKKNDFKISPIIIGENCWIGSNVIILKGVTVGDNVIIGANCLIYKDIQSNSIVKNQTNLIIEKH